MDFEPNINPIKQENHEFSHDVRVKVEEDSEWPMETVLGPNKKFSDRFIYEELEENHLQTYDNLRNTDLKENYLSYISNDNNNYEELKQNIQIYMLENDLINENVSYKKYKDRIIYEELKEECSICGIFFSDSYSLYKHNLVHLKVPLTKTKLYMCEHCPRYCKKKSDLRNHILINHIRNHNSRIPITKQRHKCLICNKTYSYKHWYSHMREVHCETKYKCKKCGVTLKSERTLKQHNTYVHDGFNRPRNGRTTCSCPECPAILDCKYALTTHLRNCHSKKSYSCHICNSKLKCKSYLLAHLRRVHHNDGVMHQCDICGKEFKSQRYVNVHIKNSHIKKEKL